MPEKKCLEKVSCHIVRKPVTMAVIRTLGGLQELTVVPANSQQGTRTSVPQLQGTGF